MKSEYTTLSTKGQIIIPAEVRDQMKLAVGTKLSIQRDGQTLIPVSYTHLPTCAQKAIPPEVWLVSAIAVAVPLRKFPTNQ